MLPPFPSIDNADHRDGEGFTMVEDAMSHSTTGGPQQRVCGRDAVLYILGCSKAEIQGLSVTCGLSPVHNY